MALSYLLLLGTLTSLGSTGTLVRVSVELNGQQAPLYPGPNGRFYVEARPGASYAVRLENASPMRLGVALDVDGLNVIDGLKKSAGQERLYILDPWGATLVRGWRSSLNDIHEFTFVDEKHSYAARTGQANGHLGWIEARVYRERTRAIMENRKAEGAAESQAPLARQLEPARDSFPGTGWGTGRSDPAIEVAFDPESAPTQLVTLRYEYRNALITLGILPEFHCQDRLLERERGGFARPPAPFDR